MKSVFACRLACALAIFHLILWGGSWYCLTSAHSLRAIRRPHLQEDAALGEKVSLFGGRVFFSPPAGLVKMTEELAAKKYPEVAAPSVAFSNAKGTVSVIAVFAEERNLSPEQLPEFKEFFTSALEKAVPGIRWLRKELVEIDGRSWIHLEYISRRAGSRDVHNDAYITSLDNRMFLFNFNSAVEEYEKSKEALQRSKATIAVKEP